MAEYTAKFTRIFLRCFVYRK